MESKVFAILKKISKEQKTELSAVSDLQDWLDLNLVTQSEFKKIIDFNSAANELMNIFQDFLRVKGEFEDAYENMANFDVDDFVDRGIQGEILLDNYDNLAEELGIEASGSPEYSDVLEQVKEIYPDFIGQLEEGYYIASLIYADLDNI